MLEPDYNRVVSEIKMLPLSDQLRLLQQMASIIRKKTSKAQTRNILELKGMGKDVWKGLDVKTYLDEERASWNG
ncbi:MAG: hypothetical protein JEZ11_02125 [Desulfobacterales bacterium]|nr:hypothetical protein [Desulfobacterales bacterium]